MPDGIHRKVKAAAAMAGDTMDEWIAKKLTEAVDVDEQEKQPVTPAGE